MIIPCYRCGKPIDAPKPANADYVIANDTVVMESREVIVAKLYNDKTRDILAQIAEVDKEGKPVYPDLIVTLDDCDEIEVNSIKELENVADIVKVFSEMRDKDIQKTGVVCPDCYKDTDTIIWGFHKKEA